MDSVRSIPSVLVFDVNETLLDIESMAPIFERIFGDKRVLRVWFDQLIMYSSTVTLADQYKDFWALGVGVLQMVGSIHGVPVTPDDVEALAHGMKTMPAHADAAEGLRQLQAAGFRMVTLTNSPPTRGSRTPLENAGLDRFFERQFHSTPLARISPRLRFTTWSQESSACRPPPAAWSPLMCGTRSAAKAPGWPGRC